MAAFPARADISGTPNRAASNSGFGALWDWLYDRFIGGSATAAEKAAARAVFEATRTVNPIDATVASNALTITIKPNASEFRSATLTSGAVTMLANAADLTLVVPNGATLGTANGVLARLAVLEINNAGTKEAAVVNLAGGVVLDERGVISTTTMSTASDSASVVYSTTGRSNVPYRIVDFIEITEASAGVWATNPSLVGGSSAPLAAWLAGYGQAWQDMSGSRSSGTGYTNQTGRPIKVSANANAGGPASLIWVVDGIQLGNVNVLTNLPQVAYFEVPPGKTYTVSASTGFASWRELR